MGGGAIKRARPAWYAEGKLKYLIQFADKPNPELKNTPLATQIASNETAREVILILSPPMRCFHGRWSRRQASTHSASASCVRLSTR